jgi:hypothetical protein
MRLIVAWCAALSFPRVNPQRYDHPPKFCRRSAFRQDRGNAVGAVEDRLRRPRMAMVT